MACPGRCCQSQMGTPCPFGITRQRAVRIIKKPIKPVGELCGLIYRARKTPGEPLKTFVHFFKNELPKLATDQAGKRLYIVGGQYRITHHGIQD